MTTIEIFDFEEEIDEKIRPERDLEFDKLQEETRFPPHVIRAFFSMEDDKLKHARPQSNISSVLCQYLLKFCVPIVAHWPFYKNNEKVEAKVAHYEISVQYDKTVYCIFENDKYKMVAIPPNMQFHICGFYIPRITGRQNFSTITVNDYYTPERDLVATGRNQHINHVRSGQFSQQKRFYTHPADKNLRQMRIFFKNEADAVEKINMIADYIEFIESYYKMGFPIYLADHHSKLLRPLIASKNLQDIVVKRDADSRYGTLNREIVDVLCNDANSDETISPDQLARENLLTVYNLGVLLGAESPIFRREHDRAKRLRHGRAAQLVQSAATLHEKLEIAKRQAVAFRKYEQFDLTKLTAKELHAIELDIAKTAKAASVASEGASLQKLCGKLKKSFTDVEDTTMRQLFKELKAQVSEKEVAAAEKKEELLEAGVCPHVFRQANIVQSNFGKPWLNTKLYDYFSENYVETGHNSCKICGEILISDSDYAQRSIIPIYVNANSFNADDALQIIIWKEATYIISTYIRFALPIPLKQFINSITVLLRDILSAEEIKLVRSKTNTVEGVKDAMQVLSSIYIYALLCAIMMENPSKLSFGRGERVEPSRGEDRGRGRGRGRGKRGGGAASLKETKLLRTGGAASTQIKKFEQVILTLALKLIISTKSTVINRLRTFTQDSIKQIFLKRAYPWARAHVKPIRVVQENIKIDRDVHSLILDPLYRYTHTAETIAHYYKLWKGALPEWEASGVDNTKDILHKSLADVREDLRRGTSIYDKLDTLPDWSANVPADRVFSGKNNAKYYKGNSFLAFDADQVRRAYTYGSFMSALEYSRDFVYLHEAAPLHPAIKAYREKYAYLRGIESRLRDLRMAQDFYMAAEIDTSESLIFDLSRFDYAINPLRHYCANGRAHVIGSYIFQKIKNNKFIGEPVEIKIGEPKKWLDASETPENKNNLRDFAHLRMSDARCGACKKLLTPIVKIAARDELSKINKIFENISNITAFYQYYETRCPEGNLHELEGKNCKKCKYETKYFSELDENYYKKYNDKFIKIQKKKQDLAQAQLDEVQRMIARRHTPAQKVPSTLPPYEYNLKNLSEWVQLAGAKYNALLNLGLSEGIKYSEIATGKANPARDETDDIAKMRAIKLRSYYYKFVRDYNFYINTDEPKKYNADLLKLHNDHFHSKKAKDFLPTFEENIDNRQIDDYAVSMPPKLFSNYLLERLLAGRMIAIHKAAPDKQKDAAAALIKYFTNVLIARDLMMSPPEVRIFKRDGDESSESESSAGTEEFSSMGSSTSSSDGTGTATSESDDSAENAADIVYTRENYDLEDEFEYDDD